MRGRGEEWEVTCLSEFLVPFPVLPNLPPPKQSKAYVFFVATSVAFRGLFKVGNHFVLVNISSH